jgi:hypothetical protein
LTIAGNHEKLPVHTLQKFPVIAREIGELPGKRFAVIVDEAQVTVDDVDRLGDLDR